MPTYSELTIAFDNDWVATDDLKISTWDTTVTPNVLNWSNIWTWVASRSTNYEVTEGAATLNPGETAAINFKAAFDLDHPTGYVTAIQNTNEVLIQSETQGENFVGAKTGVSQTGTATFTFNNYVEPASAANVDIALVRSPYYVYLPFYFDTTSHVTLTMYVWDGDLGTVPGTATYTMTKQRPTTDYLEFNMDLANTIRDSLDPLPSISLASTTQVLDSNTDGVKWVKFTASYTDTTETIADIEDTLGAIDGYGYMPEGVNPNTPTTNVLTTALERKVEREGFIMFPFVNNGTITSIDVDSDGGEINETETITSSAQSTDFVQYLIVDVSDAPTDNYITITTNPANDSYVYQIVDECRYNAIQVVFKNKHGVYDTLTMFKKRTDSMSIEDSYFKNNFISNATYNINKHQIQKINITGQEKIELNSGYVNEKENSLYKELLLSDAVYFYENSLFIPVNVKTNDLEFRTRVNDGLVFYTIEFEYAYNVINNI